MKTTTSSYQRHRFPSEIISHAVWLYHRCSLSFREVEELLAERFFRHLIKGQGQEPRWVVTDKLRSYDAAHRSVMPSVEHHHHVYANNRAEGSHQPTRQQERAMRGFKSPGHAQRFLSIHGLIQNCFRLGRHLIRAANYRILRTPAFQVGQDVVCA